MQVAILTLSATFLIVGPRAEVESGSMLGTETISSCLVTLIHEVDVPAEEPGVLVDVLAEEGQSVQEGDQLVQIDDTQVQTLKEVAEYKRDAAKAEWENDVNVRHAKAAAMVSEAELIQANEANEELRGTVSYSEIRRLALALKKARLGIEQTEHEREIAGKTLQVQEAELRAAEDDVDRRRIYSPLNGVVVHRHVQVGNWVRPGDPVVRVIGMDKLRIEGFLDATRFSPAEVDGAPVSGTVSLPRGRVEEFTGRIVFASPETEAGPQFLVKAEVENPKVNVETAAGTRLYWLLRPGDVVDMTIHLDQLPASVEPTGASASTPATDSR
jgi:macrolide-specific efflux system membrane fusion protein